MGSRVRDAQPYRTNTTTFFPRGREFNRRDAPPAAQTYRARVESGFHPPRDIAAPRDRSYGSGRDVGHSAAFPRAPDRGGSDARYGMREEPRRDMASTARSRHSEDPRRAPLSHKGAPYSGSSDMRHPAPSNGSQYASGGWFNDTHKSDSSRQRHPYETGRSDRDFRSSRNVHDHDPSSTRSDFDRYRYYKGQQSGGNAGSRDFVNPEIVMETRQLEERVAAIQRELEMLESDKNGNRSTDYRSSRNAYTSSAAEKSGKLPSLLDFNAPSHAVDKARFEREDERLRARERQLRLREQELRQQERRAREQQKSLEYRRLAAPAPPKNGTFPKQRISQGFRQRTTAFAKSRKTYKRPATYKPELQDRTRQKRGAKEEREDDETKKKKIHEAEGTKKPPPTSRTETVWGTVEKVLKYAEPFEDSPMTPRSRSLQKLLSLCDRKFMTKESVEMVGLADVPEILPSVDDFKLKVCPLTHNPTTLGLLEQYVPLGLFEEEVEEVANGENEEEVLESLRTLLQELPTSPIA
ncbi:hypothetical protein Q1695_014703 [Nippostrongylus brasiliensis]|nr:hypothetical protein Q1695_014703 [Nippostrongylus brasiliensis]